MKNLIDGLERCEYSGSWYGALFVALSLRDLCGRIKYLKLLASERTCATWFDRYVSPKYRREVGSFRDRVVFLSRGDCYAFRCADLHQVLGGLSEQCAKTALEKFQFVLAPPGITIYCNGIDGKLQL